MSVRQLSYYTIRQAKCQAFILLFLLYFCRSILIPRNIPIPSSAPAVSMSTSRTLGPLPGINRWMVSSTQATAQAQTREAPAHRGIFLPRSRKFQLSNAPSRANSDTWASFRSSPSPWEGFPPGNKLCRSACSYWLMAPEMLAGRRELPQIKTTLHTRSRTHRRLFRLSRQLIPGPPGAPAEF